MHNKSQIVENTKEIKINEVQAGDVLLSYGGDRSWISWLIKQIDGGDYSHAAFFDGECIIQAGGPDTGVHAVSLQDQVDSQEYVDVYRFKSDSGIPFSQPDWPVSPVIDRARSYLGKDYATNQLYLVGVLIVLRKMPITHIGKKFTRTIISGMYILLNKLLAKKTKAVVCSELVYRAFYEAPPEMKYGLTIKGVIGSPALELEHMAENITRKHEVNETIMMLEKWCRESSLDLLSAQDSFVTDSATITLRSGDNKDEEINRAIDYLESLYREIYPDLDMLNEDSITLGANRLVSPEMVTPHDLQSSPNLVKVGRLTKPQP
ncbi:hypothetical protein M9194_04610 [Vibrio sp. S4M6]|uniref:hypothetical protein n=1 Tax=Vibrio sinus TaxID=2946865 RepID=UPI002029E986|nr:hypothetical protein [Vibrio sinus]MCL9780718.1 hypothetical protein [Vibrio sinus]